MKKLLTYFITITTLHALVLISVKLVRLASIDALGILRLTIVFTYFILPTYLILRLLIPRPAPTPTTAVTIKTKKRLTTTITDLHYDTHTDTYCYKKRILQRSVRMRREQQLRRTTYTRIYHYRDMYKNIPRIHTMNNLENVRIYT